MVEIKLSQGAKPGHGGVLPARQGHRRNRRDARRADGPRLHFAGAPFGVFDADRDDGIHRQMRRLSGGKPAGFKLCVGHPWEFLAICKAMLETGIYPDFIVVDGKEGGTGAAPLEFIDHLGMPLREGLVFVHNALVGIGARERIRSASPARSSPPSTWRARWRWAPTGAIPRAASCSRSAASSRSAATPTAARPASRRRTAPRQRALVVPDKSERVYNFHRATSTLWPN